MRPEVASLGRTPPELPAGQPSHRGEVQSLLFDGANSAVLLREAQTRREFRIALPQTGQFSDLKPGEPVSVQLSIPSAPSAFRRGPPPRSERRCSRASRWHARLTLGLLLAPALLWLVALIVLPHIDLARPVVSRAGRPARNTSPSLAQYRTFFANRCTGTCSCALR